MSFQFFCLISTLYSFRLPICLIVFYLTAVIAIAEILKHSWDTKTEITRKIVHIASGNIIIFAWQLQLPIWILITGSILSTLAVLVSYAFYLFPSINDINRLSYGTLFYAFSIGILGYCFWYEERFQYAVIGILIMTWGDGMAAIVGLKFGKHTYQIFNVNKSWEGSLMMMGISFIVCSVILSLVGEPFSRTFIISLVTSIVATVLEVFSSFGIDNMTVPIGSAFVSFYLANL
ncbi:MAG: dolichol kinase [Candidatus Atelocyanobacterium thalassa isolate SIO64986]|uniref:Dolichol kinase n=1 Tax=Candidatus Atelocyanobacterium thalassa isolate SIO64986 TaxID=1527444 RepID=A0A086CIP8_9CHRO|nr:MAG: dolichol kinase [Candidatus Atelocyanobacterium thalassa isolate SIO64986]